MRSIKKRICLIANSDIFFESFLVHQSIVLSNYYDIHIVINSDKLDKLSNQYPNLSFHHFSIRRKKFFLIYDLILFIKLFYFFCKYNFDIVHSFTSKVGCFSMFIGFLLRIKNRHHTFTGQTWCKKNFFCWPLYKFADRIISFFSTITFADSKSQSKYLLDEKVVHKSKIKVLGNGSISGVDLGKFYPKKSLGIKIRKKLQIPLDAFVLIFVGRLCIEKGIFDLINAFSILDNKNIHLIFVGMLDDDIVEYLPSNKNIHYLGFKKDVTPFINASDLLCLPSYREGFGSVVIEAAAVGVPSLVSNIYGLQDSIIHNKTGLFHIPADPIDISSKINHIYLNKSFYKKMSSDAKSRAIKFFDKDLVIRYWVKFYKRFLND